MTVQTTVLEPSLRSQAAELEQLLPALMRALFSLDPDHPVAELPIGQLRVCTVLQHGPRSMSHLGEELGITLSAITQMADRLERAGLVERIAGTGDRRVKELRLTSYGERAMRERRHGRVSRVSAVLSHLAPAERESALCAIEALLEASQTSSDRREE